MNVTLRINCDNAAFEDAETAEVCRILRYLADDIEASEELVVGTRRPLLDSNGNRVGEFKVTG